ncbi:hypothetical protein LEP1GSC191_2042 [Leptospira borgpetersenii serovar Mini str. 201000851]|uniref:Uncharacterized protein n=2 Tax=Leptospira borgpetersenii TaxID=174 RepID=M3HN87_LEPBO|nr:hypothetical protein LEP1GSC128_2950 [Leptospira borgpetersenii str. 200801926]EMF99510.1 hypothetical protein LEP1GSC123_4263 [Leptospira borgpetersenii str. 200701203]EMN56869.1 hypothetical protein LEP1GSC090_1120 [Leptospira borgpetersenii serovar Javanica str. MK146]ENO63436.1 hypothetical protein LEP1GSC191_2042 [Leptospira borgpetersenii serovar Mini str. 201000851]
MTVFTFVNAEPTLFEKKVTLKRSRNRQNDSSETRKFK